MLSRRRQHVAFQRGMTFYEHKLRLKAGTALNSYLRQVARSVADTGTVPAHLNEKHRTRVFNTLLAHYTETTANFGKLALSGIAKGKKSALTPLEALMFSWVRREALRKARMITDTDRDTVAAAIEAGIGEGLGTQAIASNIRKLTSLTPRRASVIARTETHAAATYGSIESVRDAEQQLDMKMLKAWLPTSDSRTRPEHLAMANHPAIPLDEKFNVGGELMDRPGDPAGSAGNTIACRCSIIYSEAE
ncbi:phage minor head protein [Tautonia plasticadhaerens]|uniref:Phage Mu protein F like protein n=1 Tax=Tautonia plasticadhaerens TaxID=2527974 RepID=A0A518H243_9BACT|nr:phage minor head protein [Tautonia plasticadhaerens]QDV34919.1 Phage Mu protein F like protein [Tautonia plasticadhaerens]